ncbi:CWC16 protein [Catenaria anguillulae PL171]|uniref:CWC16 protein n=1 Tax=Catenaria anguillulae PL171 TaxID=765915 RepID=A0A1Y2I388_9FUNG|nr:CWC16 protein [Catenaria anguillulae PL171]
MQAFNKHFPKDFDPAKHNSANQHQGVHALGKRARKLKSDGILIIRFELPFNIWCAGCNNHVGMGTRYNAEKKKAGNYYSTPIWSFRMKCHLCPNWFEIRTDPKNAEYEIVEGARKRVEEFDPEDAQVMAVNSEDNAERLAADPLYRLEHATKDKELARARAERIAELRDIQDSQFEDDFSSNQLLRRKFRAEKKERVAAIKEAKSVADRIGTSLPILPPSASDQMEAMLELDHGPCRFLHDSFPVIQIVTRPSLSHCIYMHSTHNTSSLAGHLASATRDPQQLVQRKLDQILRQPVMSGRVAKSTTRKSLAPSLGLSRSHLPSSSSSTSASSSSSSTLSRKKRLMAAALATSRGAGSAFNPK